MLEGLLNAAEPEGDPQKSMMVAIARNALRKGAEQGAPLAVGPSAVSTSEAAQQTAAAMQRLTAVVEQQGKELERLSKVVERMERVCLETRDLVAAQGMAAAG